MNKNQFLVLLDAGHGGIINGEYVTPGKRSPVFENGDQYFEGEGNRLIRAEIIKLLKVMGINYYIVNNGNEDMDLEERVDIVNAICKKRGKENCLLISIHSDAFKDAKAKGWSCYTTKGTTVSDKFATILYEEAYKMWPMETLRKDTYSDGDPDKEANFYILRKTACAAVLSENFFMTNEVECRKHLMNRQGRKKIAQVHVNAILRYIDEQ